MICFPYGRIHFSAGTAICLFKSMEFNNECDNENINFELTNFYILV